MNLSKRNDYLYIFFCLFIFILLFQMTLGIVNGYAKEDWRITEFLINYQGGFVRRGLLGEMLLVLYNLFGLSPYYSILFVCIVAYIILCVFFVKSFLQKKFPILILPFVFFLGAPILNHFLVRKDILILLVFISVIFFSLKKNKLYLILVNFLFIIGLLIHEEVGFFGLPILTFIYIDKNKEYFNGRLKLVQSIYLSLLQLSPAILTFCLCLYNKGSVSIANLIWDSWKPIVFPIQSTIEYPIPGAIEGISWSVNQSLSLFERTLKNFNDGIYAPVAWILILVLIYYLLTNIEKINITPFRDKTSKTINRDAISKILIFQFISVIPLFVFGWDYGRWVFLWVTSSFSLIILIPEKKISILFPKYIERIGGSINVFLDSILGRSTEVYVLILFIIGVPSYSWDLYSYLATTPIIIVLRFFTLDFLIIKIILILLIFLFLGRNNVWKLVEQFPKRLRIKNNFSVRNKKMQGVEDKSK